MEARPQREDGSARRRRCGFTYAALVGWILTLDAWFQGPLLGGRAGRGTAALLLLAVAVLVLVSAGRGAAGAAVTDRFGWAVAGMLLVATVVRLPALAAPGSVISSDSAVA